MILKHKDIVIVADDPFKNCKLKRKSHATALTSIVRSYADGFVLSLNNPWGTGKTTFVKMWQRHLENDGFKTLYFNAWENDFDADPMVALMSELGTLTNQKTDATFNTLIKKAAVISHSVIPILLKSLAAKYIDTDLLKELLTNAGQGANDLLKEEILDYANKKDGLVEFRIELQNYIKNNTEEKPLVLFVDELDRCRPTYAVELLEKIKHFFSVPGIVFVLSIDKLQLGNAIRGFYGSEQINSNEYLRRFIDLEFSLPQPSTDDFVDYLFDYFGFDEYFHHVDRNSYSGLTYDRDGFISFTKSLFTFNGLTLRQQEKLLSQSRLVLRMFTQGHYLFPSVFILLIFIKDFHPALFSKLTVRSADPQEILDDLSNVFPKGLRDDQKHSYINTEVTLIKLYFNYYREINYDAKLYEKDTDRNTLLLINPYTDRSKGFKTFINVLDEFNSRNGGEVKLSYLLNKINFLDDFKDI